MGLSIPAGLLVQLGKISTCLTMAAVFIALAITLSAVGTELMAGLALILGIDRFMSEARAGPPDR